MLRAPSRGSADDAGVPRISAFYGIVIWMYYDEIDHRGRRHFHATYANDEASIDIETLSVIAGELPTRAMRVRMGQRAPGRIANELGPCPAPRHAAADRAAPVKQLPSRSCAAPRS
jgi:hypothetical protein